MMEKSETLEKIAEQGEKGNGSQQAEARQA